MFVLILRQNLQWFEKSLSLIDCLITLKCEGRVVGDFDVGIFLLLVSGVLETVEEELELTLITVGPLRTTVVEATEEQPELLCTEIDVSWLEQQVSE